MAVHDGISNTCVQLLFLAGDIDDHSLPPFFIDSLLESICNDVLEWVFVQPHIGQIVIVLDVFLKFFHVKLAPFKGISLFYPRFLDLLIGVQLCDVSQCGIRYL